MLRMLNAGFGEPLPGEDLDLIHRLGFDGVRQDVPTLASAVGLTTNALGIDFTALFIVPVAVESTCQEIAHAIASRAVELGAAERTILEVGNEEDLEGSKDHPKRWTHDPRGWAALVSDVAHIAAQHSPAIRAVSGGVSSVSRRAMAWLQSSGVTRLESLQAPFGIGYHQYRSTPPDKPLEGYVSRDEEFLVLNGTANGLPIWCTESGWHTGVRKSGCWPFTHHWRYEDTQIEQFLRDEAMLNERHGAYSFVVYQLNDSPGGIEPPFGIRRVDGTLKPQARVFA